MTTIPLRMAGVNGSCNKTHLDCGDEADVAAAIGQLTASLVGLNNKSKHNYAL